MSWQEHGIIPRLLQCTSDHRIQPLELITPRQQPIIIPRAEHSVSRSNISPNALKVLYRLREAGYRACLVGGGVRDLLLGREPKDFDIGTDASPEEVRRLFRNCRLIGRRFRLAHVHFGREIIEVATFRGRQSEDAADDQPQVKLHDNGRILSDNVYGTIEDDAWRRDFTINALYYDINDFAILDYADGLQDLKDGVIRLIGDPETRYREDPVRMLRAVRFAAKLGFRLHSATEEPLARLGGLLSDIPAARLFDEVLKLFMGGCAVQTYELLRHYRLFGYLFPATERCLSRQKDGYPKTLLTHALTNTDNRIGEGKPVTPAFLYAALLWEPLCEQVGKRVVAGESEHDAIAEAAPEIIRQQIGHTALPRRFSQPMQEIWALQPRLAQRAGSRAFRLLEHPRLRAAYDFLLLRVQSGEQSLSELADWWTAFLDAGESTRTGLVEQLDSSDRPKRRRRPRKRRSPRNSVKTTPNP